MCMHTQGHWSFFEHETCASGSLDCYFEPFLKCKPDEETKAYMRPGMGCPNDLQANCSVACPRVCASTHGCLKFLVTSHLQPGVRIQQVCMTNLLIYWQCKDVYTQTSAYCMSSGDEFSSRHKRTCSQSCLLTRTAGEGLSHLCIHMSQCFRHMLAFVCINVLLSVLRVRHFSAYKV